MVSCKSEYWKNFFIPSVIYECNKLDLDIFSSALYNLFCNRSLQYKFIIRIIRAQRKTFKINDSVEVKLLIRLCLGFSHARERKLRNGDIET